MITCGVSEAALQHLIRPLPGIHLLFTVRASRCVELQACDRDQQCGGGMCCAVSLWIRSLRMCTPMGNLGEECHPLSHRVSMSSGGLWDRSWRGRKQQEYIVLYVTLHKNYMR